jgi:hypothetical protein
MQRMPDISTNQLISLLVQYLLGFAVLRLWLLVFAGCPDPSHEYSNICDAVTLMGDDVAVPDRPYQV